MAASRSRARAHAKLRDQERRLVSSSALFIVCDSSAADVLRLVAQREAILYTSTRRLGKQCYCSSLSLERCFHLGAWLGPAFGAIVLFYFV